MGGAVYALGFLVVLALVPGLVWRYGRRRGRPDLVTGYYLGFGVTALVVAFLRYQRGRDPEQVEALKLRWGNPVRARVRPDHSCNPIMWPRSSLAWLGLFPAFG